MTFMAARYDFVFKPLYLTVLATTYCKVMMQENGGESGIRTHETGAPPTRFPSVRLRPLGHLTCTRTFGQGGAL